jgi:flagellar assembly factor FliW
MANRLLHCSAMAQILTRQFGPLEYDESAVLDFPAGLPGFPDQTRLVLVERASAAPVIFLQSLHREELCFLAVPVLAIDPGYQLVVGGDDLRLLGLDASRQPHIGEETLCLAILSAPENGPLTANLLAPVVVELRQRRAVQAVRADSVYSHRHMLAAAESACW